MTDVGWLSESAGPSSLFARGPADVREQAWRLEQRRPWPSLISDVPSLRRVLEGVSLPKELSIMSEVDRSTAGVAFVVMGRWEDVASPGSGRLVQTMSRVLLPPFPFGLAEFIEKLYEAAQALWLHELHERLRINGTPVVDPHPPDGSFR